MGAIPAATRPGQPSHAPAAITGPTTIHSLRGDSHTNTTAKSPILRLGGASVGAIKGIRFIVSPFSFVLH